MEGYYAPLSTHPVGIPMLTRVLSHSPSNEPLILIQPLAEALATFLSKLVAKCPSTSTVPEELPELSLLLLWVLDVEKTKLHMKLPSRRENRRVQVNPAAPNDSPRDLFHDYGHLRRILCGTFAPWRQAESLPDDAPAGIEKH